MSATSKLLKRFEKVSEEMDKFNARARNKRFQPMTHSHNHRIVEIGIYDTKYKKWALTDVRAHDADEKMSEIEYMVRNPKR